VVRLRNAPAVCCLSETTIALPDKPSLAVLPFQNLTGGPEQEYFVNGVVEEIITAISRLPWRFVIVQFELWQRAQRRESSAS
jgi:TolB-like protein